MQGFCSPCPSPKFVLLLITSTRQQFSLLLASRKCETVLGKRGDLPLERCPNTSPENEYGKYAVAVERCFQQRLRICHTRSLFEL